MKRALLTVLIILAIILLIILLLRFFRKKNSSNSGGRHEKAEHFNETRNASPKAGAVRDKNSPKITSKGGDAASEEFSAAKENEYDKAFSTEEIQSEQKLSAAESASAEDAAVTIRAIPAEEPIPVTEAAANETEPPSAAPVKSGFSLNSAVQRASALKSLNRFSRVIAINIETPNNEHDSICNIGITVGDTEKCLSTNVTVNPEEPIDDVPDGMTEEEILNSPTLKELWPGMSRLLSGSLVIAHNSAYDLTILKKALKAYGLEVPEFYQACTYRMSRKFHPEFDSYKLGSICDHYGIPLDVTNAVSHSDACFDIFCRLVDEGQPVFDEAKPFIL